VIEAAPHGGSLHFHNIGIIGMLTVGFVNVCLNGQIILLL
jgi:hypothetical protein